MRELLNMIVIISDFYSVKKDSTSVLSLEQTLSSPRKLSSSDSVSPNSSELSSDGRKDAFESTEFLFRPGIRNFGPSPITSRGGYAPGPGPN